MADIKWTVTTSAGVVENSSPTLSDANMTRFIDWAWYAYPQFQADGTTPKPRNLANEAAAVREWMEAQWQGTKANVIRWEENEAAQAARDAIADL